MRAHSSVGFERFEKKMREAGLAPAQIGNFERSFGELRNGSSGSIPERSIQPVERLPELDQLPPANRSPHLSRAVILKLNGGLGTSMGLDGPKGALKVRGEHSFLDIVARQVLDIRERTGTGLPLVLMNSFHTSRGSLDILNGHQGLAGGVPLEFLQSKVPKILADSMEPAEWPQDPDLEWCPPGHGDLYPSLEASGMLRRLLERGYRYAFVSNIDNTGAVLDPRILHWFAENGNTFLMEVTERTPVDCKGGHLAWNREGHLRLREVAQCPAEDLEAFQDIERHRFFNTNNLWLDLEAIQRELERHGGFLPLPLIVNQKRLDPRDSGSPRVYQLESAMGAAIGVLSGAQALSVPRQRFAPVKTTSDLLAVRSDAYCLDEGHRLSLVPERSNPPHIELDDRFYKLLPDFEARFPAGPPSLARCESLKVVGDVTLAAGVVAEGAVELRNLRPWGQSVPAGARLHGLVEL